MRRYFALVAVVCLVISGFSNALLASAKTLHWLVVSNTQNKQTEVDLALASTIDDKEVDDALEWTHTLSIQTSAEIESSGWQNIHRGDTFEVFKKTQNTETFYLIKGSFNDISPKTYLHCQINEEQRKLWDTNTKCYQRLTVSAITAEFENSYDSVYSRTAWPWPFSDRDYVLDRR